MTVPDAQAAERVAVDDGCAYCELLAAVPGPGASLEDVRAYAGPSLPFEETDSWR